MGLFQLLGLQNLQTDKDEAEQIITNLLLIQQSRVLADVPLLFQSPQAGMSGRGRD